MKKNIYALIFFIVLLVISVISLVFIIKNKQQKETVNIETETDATQTDATETDIQMITDTVDHTLTDTVIVPTPTDTNAVETTEEVKDTTEEKTEVATTTESSSTDTDIPNNGTTTICEIEHTIQDIPNPTTEEPTTQEPISPAISDYEFSLLCQVVECETHGADQVSKGHIVHVIRNRMARPEWGSTWASVILEPYQFGRRSDVTQDTINAVNIALAKEDTTYGSIAFHSGGYSSTFFGYRYVFTDAVGHHFYI